MNLIDRVARCTIHIETLNQFVTYSQLQETLQDFQPLVEQCMTFVQRYRNKSTKGQSKASSTLETELNPEQGGSFMRRCSSSDESESLHALEASFDRFQQHLDRGMAVQTSIVNNRIANDGTCFCYILIYQFLFILPSVTHFNLNVTLNNLVYAENCDWHSLPLCLHVVFKSPVHWTEKRPWTQPDRTDGNRTFGCGCAKFFTCAVHGSSTP